MEGPEPTTPPVATPFPDAWRRVMTDPQGFFAAMPETGGLQEPAVFLALCAAINAAGHLLGWGLMAVWVLVFQVVGAAIVAAILVLIAQHLFEGRAGFEATFRVVAYASAPSVVFWVPLLGALAGLYGVYLLIRGIERVHGFNTERAVLTVLLALLAVWLLRLRALVPWRHWHRFR